VNKADLKNFYPKGTKDELAYYSTQFNSIELDATFYKIPSRDQVITWKAKTRDGFKFFHKINQTISHFRRLNDVQALVEEYCDNISNFEEKIGRTFLQLHANFGYKNMDKLVNFIEIWIDQGLRDIYFFVHQNIEMESPFLSAYFIERLNKEFGLKLKIPTLLGPAGNSAPTLEF